MQLETAPKSRTLHWAGFWFNRRSGFSIINNRNQLQRVMRNYFSDFIGSKERYVYVETTIGLLIRNAIVFGPTIGYNDSQGSAAYFV